MLVVFYTTFGGFRAVVWTDVLQGIVMVIGVLVLMGLTLSQVGGLASATRKLAEMMPPKLGTVRLVRTNSEGTFDIPLRYPGLIHRRSRGIPYPAITADHSNDTITLDPFPGCSIT